MRRLTCLSVASTAPGIQVNIPLWDLAGFQLLLPRLRALQPVGRQLALQLPPPRLCTFHSLCRMLFAFLTDRLLFVPPAPLKLSFLSENSDWSLAAELRQGFLFQWFTGVVSRERFERSWTGEGTS